MREMTVWVRFTRPCLGIIADRRKGHDTLLLSRTTDGKVMFMARWHEANMCLAARLVGRHHREVRQICWDVAVEGETTTHIRWYSTQEGKKRCARHEAFAAGQVIALSCAVPANITDEDMKTLMNAAGRHKGISPFKPGDYGRYEVVRVAPRETRVNEEIPE